MFEREARREKILEANNRELRRMEKTKGILCLGGGPSTGSAVKKSGLVGVFDLKKKKKKIILEDEVSKEDPIKKAEHEYFEINKKVTMYSFH